jgi:TatD DNase family protein
MLVDSHCHLNRLDLNTYPDGMEGILAAAKTVGVNHLLNVCIRLDDFPHLLETALKWKDISISVGLHPTEKVLSEPEVETLISLADHPKVVALGETGLDYCHQPYDRIQQQIRFRRHIRAAKALNKPLIVHTRHAPEDTLALLEEEEAHVVGGVLHCFTEDVEMALIAIEKHNFYISFSGILTFKNADAIREVARTLPLERLLIETDSPYLAPVPFRGKAPNQPAYVRYVAERLAIVKGLSFEQIAQETTRNFFRLFPLAERH